MFSNWLSLLFSTASITNSFGLQYSSITSASDFSHVALYVFLTSRKKLIAFSYLASRSILHDTRIAHDAICDFPAPRLPIITAIIPVPIVGKSFSHCAVHSLLSECSGLNSLCLSVIRHAFQSENALVEFSWSCCGSKGVSIGIVSGTLLISSSSARA